MRNEKPVVWQLTAGSTVRCYSEVLLNHGVALLGPGDAGPWRAERTDEEFDGSQVRIFASELREGDVLLLRTSSSKICAVGLVAGPYQYLNQFDDVNGLDLQHARRVRWKALPDEHAFGKPVFGKGLRFSRVQEALPVDFARRFIDSPPTAWQRAALPELPPEEGGLSTVPSGLQGLVAEVADLMPQMTNGRGFGEKPTEDELVAHFIVPFLRALGWPPERIAVKWRCVDVALFDALPREASNCRFVIEAKRLGAGVEGALAQAQRYLKDLGIERDVVVTDGVRYRMYGSQKKFASVAYANLGRLKEPARELFSRLSRP